MAVWEKAILGFFVGLLCGAVPLAFGVLTKHIKHGVFGILASAAFGIIFSLIDKSPFTAMGIAVVFVMFIFASNKRKNKSTDDDDDDTDL